MRCCCGDPPQADSRYNIKKEQVAEAHDTGGGSLLGRRFLGQVAAASEKGEWRDSNGLELGSKAAGHRILMVVRVTHLGKVEPDGSRNGAAIRKFAPSKRLS